MRTRNATVVLTAGELLVLERVLASAYSTSIAEALGRPPEMVRADIASLLGKVRETWTKNTHVALLEQRQSLSIAGVTIECKPTSFRLLSYLVERQGCWVCSETLRSEVLRTSVQYGASNVRWHVLQARRALGQFAALLHSDNRLGFMFDVNPCGGAHCSSEPRRAPSTRPPRRTAPRA